RKWSRADAPFGVKNSVRTGGWTTAASRPYADRTRSATALELATNAVTRRAVPRSQRRNHDMPARANGRIAAVKRERSDSKSRAYGIGVWQYQTCGIPSATRTAFAQAWLLEMTASTLSSGR